MAWLGPFLAGAAVGFVAGAVMAAVLVLSAWAANDHARADLDSMDCPRPRDTSAEGMPAPSWPERLR